MDNRVLERLKDNLKFDNDEFLILKGHLFIEESINKILISYIDKNIFAELDLNFHRKLKLMCGLDSFFLKKDHIIDAIGSINKIRNKIAHNLDYDIKEDVIHLLKYRNKELPEIKSKNAFYHKMLRTEICYLVGYLHGIHSTIKED